MPGRQESLGSSNDDLTVVKQIKHLGKQKPTSFGRNERPAMEGLAVVKNSLESRKQERGPRINDPKGLTVLQGAGRLSSTELAMRNQSKLAWLVDQEKALASIPVKTNPTIQPNKNLGLKISAGESPKEVSDGSLGMQMVITVVDYQNGEAGDKKSQDFNSHGQACQERDVSVSKAKELGGSWQNHPLLPQGWKMKFKIWKSTKNDKMQRELVFQMIDGTILRGVKRALAKLKSSTEFSAKDVRRY